MTEPTTTPLQRLFEFLLYLGYAAERLVPGPDLHFESLLVALDPAQPESEGPPPEAQYVAQLFFSEDILKHADLVELQPELARASTLQFLVTFPLHYTGLSSQRLLEAYQLLMTCSQILPIGYLGINQEQQVYLNYALKAENQNIGIPLIVEILEQLGFFIQVMVPALTALKESDQPLSELVTGLEKALVSRAQV
jgi:hypothetical protein